MGSLIPGMGANIGWSADLGIEAAGRRWTAWIALALAATALHAQEPRQERGARPAADPVAEVEAQILPGIVEKLASEDPATVAWGGRLAQRFRVRSAGPALAGALAKWADREGKREGLVRMYLLDGLLGAGAQDDVDAEQLLVPLLEDERTRAAAFVLLARQRYVTRQLMADIAMRPAAPDLVRFAAAGYVVRTGFRAPGFGRLLLESADFTVSVWVRDEEPRDGKGTWNAQVNEMEAWLATPQGFPTLPVHRLWPVQPYGDAERVAGPQHTIDLHGLWVEREEVRVARRSVDRSEREVWLGPGDAAILLRKVLRREIEVRSSKTIEFRDLASLRAELDRLRDEQRREVDAIAQELIQSRWMTGDEWQALGWQPRIVIHDARIDRSVPLPDAKSTDPK